MGHCNRCTGAWARATMWILAGLLSGVPSVRAAEPAPRDYGQPADTLGTRPEPEPEEEGPNRGRVSLVVGNDFTTAYFFRGILQERNGFIWQPYAELGISLFERDEGPVRGIGLGIGGWGSFQSAQTLATGEGPENIYEIDFYPSLSIDWAGGLNSSVTYLLYTSPNGAFSTVQQIDLGLAYDDSDLLGAFALNPAATFSFEVANTSFGSKKGGYFELAGGPGMDVSLPGDETGDYPVTLTVPLAVGLSMYDYYESTDPTHNQTFGFFSFGLVAGVPLSFIPSDYGSWSLNAGINVLVLSDTLKEVNFDDNPYPVGTGSIVMEY
ncbi:MAG: hypothetical protein ACRERC_09320 [Candidatus Binatia bacterium]